MTRRGFLKRLAGTVLLGTGALVMKLEAAAAPKPVAAVARAVDTTAHRCFGKWLDEWEVAFDVESFKDMPWGKEKRVLGRIPEIKKFNLDHHVSQYGDPRA